MTFNYRFTYNKFVCGDFCGLSTFSYIYDALGSPLNDYRNV